MKSMSGFASLPAGVPMLADDILEFHAARLILLIKICGTASRMDGLTKMAKLDFFVRYPQFFETACRKLGGAADLPLWKGIESGMIRYHYGPWDARYYHVLAYLEAKALVQVESQGKKYVLSLSDLGESTAKRLTKNPAFADMVLHMKRVKKLLGNKAGTTLKNLVYQLFEDEVAQRSLGEVIR